MTHIRKTGFILLFLIVSLATAGDKFEWDEVSSSDWNVSPDESGKASGAIMLFEKITIDDQDLHKHKSYRTVYRRIRVVSAAGREWADLSIPIVHKEQKLEEVKGRAILRDGTIYELDDDHIFEKDVFKAKGVKVKQFSLSLPGVTDDCIIEYMFKVRSSQRNGVWEVQKRLPLHHGELRWVFYRGKGLMPDWARYYPEISELLSGIYDSFLTPNYLWLPSNLSVAVETAPSADDPKEVVFKVDSVTAFVNEPHSLPDVALVNKLLYYYGGKVSATQYWTDLKSSTEATARAFCKKDKELAEVVAEFDKNQTEPEKIQAVYDWCQTNIKNVSFIDDEDFEGNNSLDDVLKNRAGTSTDINYVFYAILNRMGIIANIAFSTDRDENVLVPNAKYWQFDRSLIAVKQGSSYDFYAPGELYLQAGQVPWFNEGTSALVAGTSLDNFFTIPFSATGDNATTRVLNLKLQDEETLVGEYSERRAGHAARELLLMKLQDETDGTEELKDEVAASLIEAKVESIFVEPVPDKAGVVDLKAQVELKAPLRKVGSRRILEPMALIAIPENPFETTERRSSILFDYAYKATTIINIELPSNLGVEALPEPQEHIKTVGNCNVKFQTSGPLLTVMYQDSMRRAYWQENNYLTIKNLFADRRSLQNIPVMLKTTVTTLR